jgi:hypothetical protein
MNSQQMVERGRSHTALRSELARQGLLLAHEQELLLDAADALLFDEPDALVKRAQAMDLLDTLEVNGRRSEREAERLRGVLAGCGEAELAS